MSERPGTILTVGHSTRAAEDFVALLASHGVELLADVRRHPGSRRHPQFGSDVLRASLAEAGMAYRHFPDLGGRRRVLPDSRNGAWRVRGFRGYADHMGSDAFRDSFADLVQDAAHRRTAVMCAEAVPWRCHRRLLADALVARGWEVLHVLTPTRAERHRLHPAARVTAEGSLVYPAPEDEQGRLL